MTRFERRQLVYRLIRENGAVFAGSNHLRNEPSVKVSASTLRSMAAMEEYLFAHHGGFPIELFIGPDGGMAARVKKGWGVL